MTVEGPFGASLTPRLRPQKPSVPALKSATRWLLRHAVWQRPERLSIELAVVRIQQALRQVPVFALDQVVTDGCFRPLVEPAFHNLSVGRSLK